MLPDVSIEKINQISPYLQKKLKKMGIETLEDLLFHFPHRYEDFSNLENIKDLNLGEETCISGKILGINASRTWKKNMIITEAIIQDKTGAIKAVWFNQSYIAKTLKTGDKVYLAGKVSRRKEEIYLSNPIYEKVSDRSDTTHTKRMIPVYPETEGLSSRWLRRIIKSLIRKYRYKIPEPLPKEIIETHNLSPIQEAIWQIHFPDSTKKANEAKKRFSFEKLFFVELSVLREKLKVNQQEAPSIKMNVELIKRFVSSLPFSLTDAQRKCAWQILKDIEGPSPMSRLLQGDVGSGKTIVAAISALQTIKSNYQVALMAPTEVLTNQHFREITNLLRPFKVKVAILTGKKDKTISLKLENENLEISRKKLLEKTRKGEIDFLIGTHSLIQNQVKFHNLGLSIVDEQHRFGVLQRAKLTGSRKSGELTPHLLTMTATPIPRSLALTIYGSLDLSVIDEMPKGRKPIKTEIVPPDKREKAYNFIKKRIEAGEQVFVICPRIEPEEEETSQNKKIPETDNTDSESEEDASSHVKAVKQEYEKLNNKVFSGYNVEMLHGKMKSKDKEKIMKEFRDKDIDILVSTSVIELGVDIPKATVMIIEGAERFGLSQLHQFRGRVGRSKLQSYCFLFPQSYSQKTRKRLEAMLTAKNGFELAQKDLEIRGPGSIYTGKQWGIPDLAMKNLSNIRLIENTRQAAKSILESNPTLENYPNLKRRLNRFKQTLHLE